MSNRIESTHLRLVRSSLVVPKTDQQRPVQGALFPFEMSPVLCIVHMPTISDEQFASAFSRLRPSQAFDLRTVPSFKVGRFNRLSVFSMFEEKGVRYFDVPGLVGAVSCAEARSMRRAMIDTIGMSVRSAGERVEAIMVFLDDRAAVRTVVSSLPAALPSRRNGDWTVLVLPES